MIEKAAIRKHDRVFTGHRHSDIFRKIEMVCLRDGEQGFVTDEGKFVDREEAAKIAYMCGQVHERKSVLYSEDLY